MNREVVPCNGCAACCKRERIILGPQDTGEIYLVEPTRKGSGPIEFMLAHKPNGDCIYLTTLPDGGEGCSIWDRAPQVCQEFDCRKWFAEFDQAHRPVLLTSDLDGPTARAALKRT